MADDPILDKPDRVAYFERRDTVHDAYHPSCHERAEHWHHHESDDYYCHVAARHDDPDYRAAVNHERDEQPDDDVTVEQLLDLYGALADGASVDVYLDARRSADPAVNQSFLRIRGALDDRRRAARALDDLTPDERAVFDRRVR
jgi:hypothetical protein